MVEARDGWSGEAADRATEITVLQHALELHPVLLTPAELVRELTASDAEFADEDAVERAVRDLVGVGLLHHHGELVVPTRAAIRFHELLS